LVRSQTSSFIKKQ